MKHIFIINPNAGKSDQTNYISTIVHQLFTNREIEGTYRIEKTTSRQDTIDIARKYAQKGEKAVLYACGGDGTLNDILGNLKLKSENDLGFRFILVEGYAKAFNFIVQEFSGFFKPGMNCTF